MKRLHKIQVKDAAGEIGADLPFKMFARLRLPLNWGLYPIIEISNFVNNLTDRLTKYKL